MLSNKQIFHQMNDHSYMRGSSPYTDSSSQYSAPFKGNQPNVSIPSPNMTGSYLNMSSNSTNGHSLNMNGSSTNRVGSPPNTSCSPSNMGGSSPNMRGASPNMGECSPNMGESSPNVGEESEGSRRAHHNALERKRRDHIKDSFEALKQTIPCLEGSKVRRLTYV